MSGQMFDVRGKRVFTASDRGTEVSVIPASVYTVEFNPMTGWYLERAAIPSRPKRLYGDVADRAQRILNTYHDRLNQPGKNTAALLSGNKGSGKTMLSAEVAVAAVEAGLPVILVEAGHTDSSFFKFLNSITQPCIVLIDEFEKKYKDDEEQNALLGLLDGINAGGKLFILTSNNSTVSQFLMSRPSRIFYHYRYEKLDEATVVGYCNDNLTDAAKHHQVNIKTLWDFSTDFNFDILQCLVEELNRYPAINFVECLKVLNIVVNGLTERRFVLEKFTLDGEDISRSKGQMFSINVATFVDGYQSLAVNGFFSQEEDMLQLERCVGKVMYHHNLDYFKQKAETGKAPSDDFYDGDFTFYVKADPSRVTVSAEEISGMWDIEGRRLEVKAVVSRKSSEQDLYEKIFVSN